MLARYETFTGYKPRPELIELYTLRWDLTDLALFATDFRRTHGADANRAKGWEVMQRLVRALAGRP